MIKVSASKRWTFDDYHIGTASAPVSTLETRDIERPPGLAIYDWYKHASNVCAKLNNLPETPHPTKLNAAQTAALEDLARIMDDPAHARYLFHIMDPQMIQRLRTLFAEYDARKGK